MAEESGSGITVALKCGRLANAPGDNRSAPGALRLSALADSFRFAISQTDSRVLTRRGSVRFPLLN
jgi:hypothetical protein